MKSKPFLKWAGGKYRLLLYIKRYLPNSAHRLIEPFVGSGALFLNTDYSNYLLADHNRDLINVYQYLQKKGLQLIDDCENFFTAENNQAEKYYKYRLLFNESKDTYLKSILFIYLNRHGYNGLCRYNSHNIFNVPFGRYVKPYFPRKEMLYFYEKSQKAEFICSDFVDTIQQANKHDVIYCDPPYLPISKTASFTKYNGQTFLIESQNRLADLAKSATCTTLISNHDIPFARQIYQGARIIKFDVFRCISCQGQKRKKIKELIAIYKK